jgi:hypothetical protein
MNENLRDEVLTEQIAESHFTLTVEQPQEGFWCSLRLFARVPMPPEEIYALLVSPKNHLVFRSLEPPRSRRILDDHGRYQTAEVEQVRLRTIAPAPRQLLFRSSMHAHSLPHSCYLNVCATGRSMAFWSISRQFPGQTHHSPRSKGQDDIVQAGPQVQGFDERFHRRMEGSAI